MFQKNKRVSLLSYWTSRYVVTLIVGLLFVSIISALWIRHTSLENRLELMTFMAEETVHRITDVQGENVPPKERIPPSIGDPDRFKIRDINPYMYITGTDGTIVSVNRPFTPMLSLDFEQLIHATDDIVKIKESETNELYYVVKKQIKVNDEILGWVFLVESKSQLVKVNQAYGQLAIFILTLAILGWIAIYFLSRRLSQPIMNVAKAAKQVQNGNYEVNLPSSIKEKEVYELVSSFKEMAGRLEQLEKTRTELLAGVTHELKTPVTSISGLLQAVKDGVVTGDEAEEFIKMALVETTKMKTMVGDLLAFNTFAVDAVPVKLGEFNANELIEDIVLQWEVTNKQSSIEIEFSKLLHNVEVSADLVRVQQIITNLLTNAQQAMKEAGKITISLEKKNSFVSVYVSDTGTGIREEDQPFIFERFFRGENKKFAVRGLGLGLPLSKMMAQSIGGELKLVSSNEQGTCFELKLAIVQP